LWNINNFNNIKTILKNNKENILLYIIDNLVNSNPHVYFDINTEIIQYIINNHDHILFIILEYYNVLTPVKNIILNIIISNNLINNFIYKQFKSIMLLNNFFKFYLYTKFLEISKIFRINYIFYNKIILLNKFLHKLRLKMKRKYNNKIINNDNLKNKLLNEIITFKPNSKYNVQKNGSIYYQNIINYNKFCLNYTQKNIYCFLPFDIYPHTNLFFKHSVICTYVVEHDLYIILDIYINNISNDEKNNLLIQLHPKFNNYSNLQSFITENNKTKWFPCLKNI